MYYGLTNSLGRTNSGFSPLKLHPALWLDANDSSTLYNGLALASPDEPISLWRDKSGNGRHATQSTGVSQPLRKIGIQNGKDVVRFDGANDVMVHSLSGALSSVTIITVVKHLSFTGFWGNALCIGPSDNTGASMFLRVEGSTKWGTFDSAARQANTTIGTSNFSLLCMVDNAASGGVFYFNGASDGTWPGNTLGNSSANIGGIPSQEVNADFAEILVFPTALSDADRQSVEAYLNAKWAIY